MSPLDHPSSIPAAPNCPPPMEPPLAERGTGARPFTHVQSGEVLVVDDNALQLKLSALRLTAGGLRVRTATSAVDALAMARAEPPDAILSDVVMGDVDGFQFCCMVRGEPALEKVPIVLVSSHFRGTADRLLAQAVGADALIERTPGFEAELAAIQHSLERRSAERTSSPSGTIAELYARSVAGQLTQLAHDSRASDLKYRALFEHASDAVAVVDPSGLVLDVNPRWEELLQRPRAEIVGRRIREFAARDRAASSFQVETVPRRGGIQLLPLSRPDDTVVYVEISSVAVPIGGDTMLFSIGRDVTEMVEAKRKLELSERQYRSLVENIPDVIWSMTPNGRITFMSPNVLAITGYSAEELVARQNHDRFWRVHPDDRAGIEQAFRALLSASSRLDLEVRTQHKSGEWRWIHARAIAIRDEHGAVERIDGIYVDITDRKQLEEQVQRAQRLEAVGQLTSGVAHDFNNILAVILGNAHFLLDDLRADDPRRADADDIRQAAERAAALTRQLLAFSRQQAATPTVVELGTVVSGLEKMLRRLLSEDIAMSIEVRPDTGNVHADAGQLEQVIMNLVVNARDAMPEGGALKIECAGYEIDGTTHHPCSFAGDAVLPRGSYVRLTVRDTGCGMDDQVKQRIFEPFFTTKGPGKGTGLGLSTCYGIVRQSHGFIAVDSAPGQGAAFHIYLPRIEQPAYPQPVRATTSTVHGHETVLLIEDDPALCKTLQRALRERGYCVLTAVDGSEALALAVKQKKAIDLVLSDVVLPGIDGLEITERLRVLIPHTKILLMSGHTDHALLEKHALAPGSTILQKPFAPEDLALRVRRLLDA